MIRLFFLFIFSLQSIDLSPIINNSILNSCVYYNTNLADLTPKNSQYLIKLLKYYNINCAAVKVPHQKKVCVLYSNGVLYKYYRGFPGLCYVFTTKCGVNPIKTDNLSICSSCSAILPLLPTVGCSPNCISKIIADIICRGKTNFNGLICNRPFGNVQVIPNPT